MSLSRFAGILYPAHYVSHICQAERYLAWDLPSIEQNVFSQRDIERHNSRRAEVSALYSNTFIYGLEKPLNTVLETLLGRFSTYAKTEEAINLFDWLHFFAFDAIGIIIISR